MEPTVKEERKSLRVYKGQCPHCKVIMHIDFEIQPGVRKYYRIKCPKCNKEVKVLKNPVPEDKDKSTG